MDSTTAQSSVPLDGDFRSSSEASGGAQRLSSAQNSPVATPYFSSSRERRALLSARSRASPEIRHSTAADLIASAVLTP